MADIRSSLFGRLALATRQVTVEQMQECLDLQVEYEKSGQKVPRLGELLAAKGYLTANQVREILRQQRGQTKRKSERAVDPVKQISKEESQILVGSDPGTSERRTSGEVFGQFKILKRLGADSSGYTYKARYLPKDLVVTLRVLSQEKMAHDPGYVKDFELKVKKATELKHPNIQRVVAAGRKHGRDFYAAEYVEGISLRRILEARGKLDPEFAVSIAIQLAQALEYGHAHGVFHQAIRPSNVLVCPDRKVKLVAFGVAHDVMGNLKMLSEAAGDTPFYIAPEQAIDDTAQVKCDARTDIYCFGVTMYHALTGEPPFKGDSLEEVLLNLTEEEVPDPTLLNPDVPMELANLILSMMNPEPDKRYQTATHLLSDLQAIESELSAPKVGTRAFKPVRKEESTVGPYARSGGTRAHRPVHKHETRNKARKGRRMAGREDTPVITMVAGGAVLFIAVIAILYMVLKKPSQPVPPPVSPPSPSPFIRNSSVDSTKTDTASRQKTGGRSSTAAKSPPVTSNDRKPGTRNSGARPEPNQTKPVPADDETKEKPPVPTWLRDMHDDDAAPPPKEEPKKPEPPKAESKKVEEAGNAPAEDKTPPKKKKDAARTDP